MVLGHRLEKPSTSVLTYGRSSRIEPLRKMDRVLQDVEDRRFFPDAQPSALIFSELSDLDEQTERFASMMKGDPRDDSASEVDDAEEHEDQAEDVVPQQERRSLIGTDACSTCLHRKANGSASCVAGLALQITWSLLRSPCMAFPCASSALLSC